MPKLKRPAESAKPTPRRMVKRREALASQGLPQEITMAVQRDEELQEAALESDRYPRTELGIARRLIDSHGEDLRYVAEFRRWLVWDGRCWCQDWDGAVQRRVKGIGAVIRAEAETLGDKKLASHAARAEAAAGVRSVCELASTEAEVVLSARQLDADPMLLNVTNGTIDLRTGELRPHRREDLITKLAPVSFEPEAACPTWDEFLRGVFGGDEDLIGFVQRFAGYSLTGDVREQVMVFCYGTGANGKSTLLSAIRAVMGDYSTHLNSSVLAASNHDQHPTGLTDLRGARLASTSETQSGGRLNEALIKDLTGGDPITARRMNQDFSTFDPSHKVWMVGNYKPDVRGGDEGIWRRLALIPFEQSFTGCRADPSLKQKLEAELPGILAWMVRGATDWQRGGLRVPVTVSDATERYRQEQDHLGAFLEECCVPDPAASTACGPLRNAYEHWCTDSGDTPVPSASFWRELTARGYPKDGGGRRGRRRLGLALRTKD